MHIFFLNFSLVLFVFFTFFLCYTAGQGHQLLEGNAVWNVLRKDQEAQPTIGALMQRGLQRVVTVVFPLMEAGAQGRW